MNAEDARSLRPDVATDWQWSDTLIDSVRRIVGPHLLIPSSLEVDTKQAADLVVFRAAADVTVAARVRRPGYAERFPDDFTIRSGRASGARTELSKILDGWGTWLFYGHEQPAGGIGRWMIIDLDAFRGQHQNGYKGRQQSNRDGRTWFQAFDIKQAAREPRLVVASNRRPELGVPPSVERRIRPAPEAQLGMFAGRVP